MRRYLYIITLVALLAPAFTACEDGLAPAEELIGDIFDDSGFSKSYDLLEDYDNNSYPKTNTWTIKDKSASVNDFDGLHDAYYNACNWREITLKFPYLTNIPSNGETGAFYWWDLLTAIELLEVNEIGDKAFFACQALTSIKIPQVSEIGAYAFYDCSVLTSIDISSVEILENNAFEGCKSLTSIDIPYVDVINDATFHLCSSLTEINAPRATETGGYAFKNCDALRRIELPRVEYVRSGAFYDCDILRSIDLPNATDIEYYAFNGCYKLATLSLATASNVKLSAIDSEAFSSTDTSYITLTLGEANKALVKGNTLTVGDFSAEFKDIILVDGNGDESTPTYSTLADFSKDSYPAWNSSDTWRITDSTATTTDFAGLSAAIAALNDSGRHISLEFPYLQAIPDYAIFGKYERDSDFQSAALVSISADVATSVGEFAFWSCDALTSIELPEATLLNTSSFSYCSALKSIELPAAEIIGHTAFYVCEALVTAELPAATEIGDTAFGNCYKLAAIEIPAATVIGHSAFRECDALTSIELATDDNTVLSSIDYEAFLYESTNDIILTLGKWNREFVSGNTLTVGDFSSEFKQIILVDEYGDVVEQEKPSTAIYLAELSASNYPTDTDTWTIWDYTAETTDFAGLSAAIATLNDSGRQIALEFPNIDTIPSSAIYGSNGWDSDFPTAALVSVSADNATSVGEHAFYSCNTLRSIELPATRTIGTCAFTDCTALTSITLPAVTNISNLAFCSCNNLASVNLPTALTIGPWVFEDCDALTSVEIPVATTISDYAFCKCDALTSLDIPSSVTTINGGAFYGCDNLTTININTPNFIFEDGVVYNSDKSTIISALKAVINSNYSSSSATCVESRAFSDCDLITSIQLPMATVVESTAFSNCDALTSIELATADNAVLSSIDNNAFWGIKTTDITLTLGEWNGDFVSGNTLAIGDFNAEFKRIILVDENGDEVINEEDKPSYAVSLAELSASSYPSTDTWTIWDYTAQTTDFAGLGAAIAALNDSGRQISLEFPNLRAIPDYAIFGASASDWQFPSDALVSVSADVATEVGVRAFYYCSNLATVKLPEVTLVDSGAFYNCDALATVEIPAATTIGNAAFWNCDALTSIDLPQVTTIDNDAFCFCYQLSSVEIPKATSIGLNAFGQCTTLASLEIPSWVTFIGGGAFSGCDNLTTLSFNSNEYIYDNGVIYNNDKSVIVSTLSVYTTGDFYSESATTVLNNAFCGCKSLTSIELPEVTTIESQAFISCEALTSVKLPKATEIGGLAFQWCRALPTIELPEVTSIPYQAFLGCYSLTSARLNKATEIGYSAFAECRSLASLSIATDEGVVLESIKESAFDGLTTSDISLIIGKANSESVSANKLTIGDFSAWFKQIVLRNSSDPQGGDAGNAPDLGYDDLL